jgi:acylpyruvate hydrolase
MRFMSFKADGEYGLAVRTETGAIRGLLADDPNYPGDLRSLIGSGRADAELAKTLLFKGREFDAESISVLPPLRGISKIICVGLNYADHTAETGFEAPAYPNLFVRFESSLVGHGDPIIRPQVSQSLDFEGELAAVVGKGGRHIAYDNALEHIAGYSVFNDASIRDFQLRTTQWTAGKNFDRTGAFGPHFVTADELPPGCKGLRLATRLNGKIVQSASTSEMIFDVASLVQMISAVLTLEAGDVIVTGTPAGVGMAREPKLYMEPGDVCEVEIEQVGLLRNVIADEELAP